MSKSNGNGKVVKKGHVQQDLPLGLAHGERVQGLRCLDTVEQIQARLGQLRGALATSSLEAATEITEAETDLARKEADLAQALTLAQREFAQKKSQAEQGHNRRKADIEREMEQLRIAKDTAQQMEQFQA